MTHNLEAYRVFYYVAGCGSLTLAAQALSISQPAVSQAVKQLEGNVGTPLFIRTSKGVRLTTEGELLYRYVKEGYELLEQGENKLKQMMNLELGEIHIGASDMTLQFFLLPYLESFHEKYPHIKVMVTNGPTPETLRYLKEGKIDFGIVSSPILAEDGISVNPVRTIQDIFVAGRRFIQYKNKMLDLQELEKLPLISLEKTTSTRSYMDGYLRENGVEIHPEFELATSPMIVQFALRNLGVGSVVKDFALEYLESGRLFELRFNKIIPARQFCVVTNEATPLSAAARNMLQIIKSEENGGYKSNDDQYSDF